MPTLYTFQTQAILRRLAEIESECARIIAAPAQAYGAARSAQTSAQMARDELLRAVLADVPAEPVPMAAE